MDSFLSETTTATKSMDIDEWSEASSTVDTTDPPVYVFVFAHPDDESMFFVPTIKHLVEEGREVWFLCLTTGNYDGLGTIREKELEQAGRLLGASKVIVRNDTLGNEGAILDHPTKRYDKAIVAAAIRDSLSKHHKLLDCYHRFVIVTFDERGVSGHVNHTDVYNGVVHLMEEQQQRQQQTNRHLQQHANDEPTEFTICRRGGDDNSQKQQKQQQQPEEEPTIVEAWYLESEPNYFYKYVPVLSWILLLVACFVSAFVSYSSKIPTTTISSETTRRTTKRVFRRHDPRLNWATMATHHSQFVWYRRLFVVFSCYTYYNKLLCTRPSRIKKETPKKH